MKCAYCNCRVPYSSKLKCFDVGNSKWFCCRSHMVQFNDRINKTRVQARKLSIAEREQKRLEAFLNE